MSISLEDQIKKLIQCGVINLPYVQNFNRNKKVCNEISDVNDGKIYKKLKSKSDSFLTYNFSVDGLALLNNTKGSLWPILVTINEIPPTVRFQNVLLARLWLGKKEPKLDIYMKPFMEEAVKLADHGIYL